jgi:SSS family solute:Na+ symporter
LVSLLIALFAARPLLAGADQVFQIIQEYTGFFTPGIVAIFVLRIFWPRATELGAIAAIIGSFAMSLGFKVYLPEMPFLDQVGVVFLACLAAGVALSYLQAPPGKGRAVDLKDITFKTSAGFNRASAVAAAILIFLYGI